MMNLYDILPKIEKSQRVDDVEIWQVVMYSSYMETFLKPSIFTVKVLKNFAKPLLK